MKLLSALLLVTAVAGCAAETSGPPPLTCDEPLVVTAYRVDAVEVPDSPSAAEDLGVDLDGDASVDNQVGNVLSAIIVALGEDDPWADVTPTPAQRLADDVDWRLERSTCPRSGESRLALADDVVPLGLFADILGGADPGWAEVSGALVSFAPDDTGVSGRITAGLVPGYEDVFAAVYARVLTDRSVRRDVFANPDVDEFVDRIDRNGDRVISEAELRASSLFVTLMRPDLAADDHGNPDRLSLGVGFHATAVPAAP